MSQNKMYEQRIYNVAFHRGCGDENGKWCGYCAFERLIKFNKNCPKCAAFEPHTHPEVLNRKPPKTMPGEFVTFSLAGEVSFMNQVDFALTWQYMKKYPETTFLIQSKNPACFLKWQETIPENCIVGTTIETNRSEIQKPSNLGTFDSPFFVNEYINYSEISKAPLPYKRYASMIKLKDAGVKLLVTSEPLLDCDIVGYGSLYSWILKLNPIFYIGYCNDGKQGKRLKLPEPPLAKTLELIRELEKAGIDVRLKSIRKAWWEQ